MNLTPRPLGTSCQDSLPSRFRVSTWNVWFDKHLRAERNAALLLALERHRPHIMAFQEVTPPFVRALQACPWLSQGYWISGVDHNEIGVVLVGRVQVQSLSFQPLTSSMGRRLLVADFGAGFSLASAHFESNHQSSQMRASQFKESLEMLRSTRAWSLTGDFNCSPESEENQVFQNSGVDAWSSLCPQDPGFTYNTQVNAMALAQTRSPVMERTD